MKKLKLSLLIALLGMVSLVSAQDISFNVKGGLNLSNFSGDIPDTKMKPGFHIGVGADFEFAPNISILSGLFFSNKGAKIDGEIDLGDYDILAAEVTVNANYLQLPVHVAYKIDVMPGTKVVLHGGPYIAYGIGGKTKAEIAGLSEKVDTFGSDGLDLKPFDVGLGLGVGAEFGKILVDLGWDMGLSNISNNVGEIKTQNAYLSLGYKF